MNIRDAHSPDDYAQVAELMQAFIRWHYERHAADRAIVDSYFDQAAFEAELRALPGAFAPPAGALLVAEEEARIAGCVAVRAFSPGCCEMKRLFVGTDFHGRGVGQALAGAIVERARVLGYSTMLLETGPAQREAQGLYRKLGFKDVAAYHAVSEQLRDWLVFMKLDLTG